MLQLLALMLHPAAAQDPEGAPVAAPAAIVEPAPTLEPVPEPVPEPAPVVEATPDARDGALTVVDTLIAEERWDEARSLLNWLMQPDMPEATRAAARQRLALLPKAGDAAARLRLLPWQTAAGAWLMGPNMIWINETRGNFNEKPLLVFTGALAGGAGGAAASLLYKREEGLSQTDVTTIIHMQQLGMINGAVLSLAHPDGEYWEYAGWGLLGGGIAGTAGGYTLARLPLDEGGVAMARTGAASALGLGFLTLLTLDDRTEWLEYEARHDVPPLLILTDLGTVGGYALGKATGMRRVDAQMIFLGEVAGTLVGGGLAVATQDLLLWSESGVFGTMEVFAIGGGVLGYVLARGIERPLPDMTGTALLSGTDEAPRLRLPLPAISPVKGGWSAQVQLVDLRF